MSYDQLIFRSTKRMSKFKCDKQFKCYLEHFGVKKCATASKRLLTGTVQSHKVLSKKKNMDYTLKSEVVSKKKLVTEV